MVLADTCSDHFGCKKKNYTLENRSANEVSAISNGIKTCKAMYSMKNAVYSFFCVVNQKGILYR